MSKRELQDSPSRERRRRFALEYLKCMNATKAAKAVGYSPRSCMMYSSILLRHPEVIEILQRERAKLVAKLEVSAERVISELARLAFYDPRDFFHPDGRPKQINELDDDTARCLAGLEVIEGGDEDAPATIRKYKLVDKGANLERLGRYLGLFEKPEEIGNRFEIVVRHILGPRDNPSTETKPALGPVE